jgi:hypothetical protein
MRWAESAVDCGQARRAPLDAPQAAAVAADGRRADMAAALCVPPLPGETMKPSNTARRWTLMLLPLALAACSMLLPPKPATPPTPPAPPTPLPWIAPDLLPEPGDSRPLWPLKQMWLCHFA